MEATDVPQAVTPEVDMETRALYVLERLGQGSRGVPAITIADTAELDPKWVKAYMNDLKSRGLVDVRKVDGERFYKLSEKGQAWADDPVVCPECGKYLVSELGLVVHMRSAHGMTWTPPKDDSPANDEELLEDDPPEDVDIEELQEDEEEFHDDAPDDVVEELNEGLLDPDMIPIPEGALEQGHQETPDVKSYVDSDGRVHYYFEDPELDEINESAQEDDPPKNIWRDHSKDEPDELRKPDPRMMMAALEVFVRTFEAAGYKIHRSMCAEYHTGEGPVIKSLRLEARPGDELQDDRPAVVKEGRL